MYDLVKQVRSEVRDFLDETIPIVTVPKDHGEKSYEYHFSQRENVALIDLYWNSQFKSGKYDPQGHEKIFMNKGKFRSEVAEMQIDIDVSNYLFIPTGADYWTPWFMSKDFHDYVREHDFGELINDWGADLPRYGTAVSEKVGDEVLRVPLRQLMNTQDAESLFQAATSGGYVIKHMELTPHQMEEYPDWNLGNLDVEDRSKPQTVYQRHGLITEYDIEVANGKQPKHNDSENFFLGMAVVATDVNKKQKDTGTGLLYAEEVNEDDFPYNEVHWARQDGRWQGIGEMENQYQNQLAANLSTYYRQKSMYWAGSRMFSKNVTEGPDNLAIEVEDGGVIDLGPGGQMTPINTQTQHLADFGQWDQAVEDQADKASFTYEGASGDSPKAGTPYSLQVMVDNTLQKHFGKKKERFGAFLRRILFDQQVEIFKADRRKEHTMSFNYTDEGMELLREATVQARVTDRWLDGRLSKKRKSLEQIEEEVRAEMEKSPYIVATIPAKSYDNALYTTDLILTGERRNIFAEMETLKTLLQDARAEGDMEGAAKLKRELVSLTGRMPAGEKAPQQAPQAQAPQAPELPVPVSA